MRHHAEHGGARQDGDADHRPHLPLERLEEDEHLKKTKVWVRLRIVSIVAAFSEENRNHAKAREFLCKGVPQNNIRREIHCKQNYGNLPCCLEKVSCR